MTEIRGTGSASSFLDAPQHFLSTAREVGLPMGKLPGRKHEAILYVDDQMVARKYFTQMFSGDYEVLTARDAKEAWNLLRQHGHRTAVIITDQRMPDHSGVDLLMAVRLKYPQMVRLLTTAYTDLDEAIDAVSRGDIHAYVYKPWNIDELGLDIRRAVSLHLLQRERDSLRDLHGADLNRALAADRLRAYGYIASACSGLVDRPLAATLAFWSDSIRHFRRSDPPPARGPMDAASDQAGKMMACASRIGTWLATSKSAATTIDATDLGRRIVQEENAYPVITGQSTIVTLDPSLFIAGTRKLIAFLRRTTGRSDRTSISLGVHHAYDGGILIEVGVVVDMAGEPDVGHDAVDIDSLGLKAYLAIHHHGGSLTVSEWGPHGGVVTMHLPAKPPVCSDDAEAEYQAALLRQW